jgi:hypothetical protein
VPYLRVWEWKPPSNPAFTALLSVLAGGDPYWLAVLSILTTVGAVVGSIALVGVLVHHHTDDAAAAYSAGTALLTFDNFFRLAAQGFRPKHFLIFFGLVSIYLFIHKYYALSGASAAVAAGFWQFGIIFPVIVVVGAFRSVGHSDTVEGRIASHHRRVGRAVTGMVVATALIVLPIIVGGGAVPMVMQVVLGVIAKSEPHAPLLRLLDHVVSVFGAGLPVMALGLVGALFARRVTWWIPVGGGWFVLQIAVFDLDGPPDLFPLAVFCALGYGVLAHRTDEHVIPLLLVCGIAALVIVQLMIGAGSLGPQPTSVPDDGSWKYEHGTAEWYYWTQPLPNTCHIWNTRGERRLTRALGGSLSDAKCRYGFWNWIDVGFG